MVTRRMSSRVTAKKTTKNCIVWSFHKQNGSFRSHHLKVTDQQWYTCMYSLWYQKLGLLIIARLNSIIGKIILNTRIKQSYWPGTDRSWRILPCFIIHMSQPWSGAVHSQRMLHNNYKQCICCTLCTHTKLAPGHKFVNNQNIEASQMLHKVCNQNSWGERSETIFITLNQIYLGKETQRPVQV